ncbi:paraquat-inducible protein A [Vibrio nitrifigilis]|uniref:Paraquat-inducible protein A n=1 Tax=Vibrio nitrifigilis TaxID=2789781 RepID=A0ABS0GDH4_9VIBR|nr:paraquat-inducible protein A [Vibrio nitrifigilis]MBF9000457.1 paraquat-inducible protein A [Vibrio nitrifigilis]
MPALNNTRHAPPVRLCQGCGLPILSIHPTAGNNAYCPRCGTQQSRGGSPSLSGNLAIALTCLLLFIPAYSFPFIHIHLLGVNFHGSIVDGAWCLIEAGYFPLGVLVFFCSVVAPITLCLALVLCHISLHKHWFIGLRIGTSLIRRLKTWTMIDVFLVSILVACIKLSDISDISVGPALYALIGLQILCILLITRVSLRRYWELWRPEVSFEHQHKHIHCNHCHLSQPEGSHCQRCHHTLHVRKPRSIERTSAYLMAATVALIPANILPISILLTNGQRLEDTIFSGVISLLNSQMVSIAIIIFVASIIVPIAKIVGLGYILYGIRFQTGNRIRQMKIYQIIKVIGKWSMLDLFVISIMLTLVDRGQILNFVPGNGAIAFGLVVFLTLLATESLDPRLIWDSTNEESAICRSADE